MELDILNERYYIDSILGHGEIADVYLGQDYQLNRDVAIKILRAALVRDTQFIERFMRQARSAASLSHPNIVSIYATGTHIADDGPDKVKVPFIVMEYVAGNTLQEHIRRQSMFIDQSISYTLEILSALGCSHQAGIVHRDIKPTNIIIDKVKNTVKVTDFSIAETFTYLTDHEKTASGAMTAMPPTLIANRALITAAPHHALETALYISPEQARGELVDVRSDLYSVAVMLYQMLTGKTPFTGASAVEVAFHHVSEIPVSPRAINPDVSTALDAAVMKALNKDPRQRFETAAEFSHALSIARKEKIGYHSAYSRAAWKHSSAVTGSSDKEQEAARVDINNILPVYKSRSRLFKFLAAGFLIITALAISMWPFF